jgi:uncharacterized iron-regulated membrane protein
VGLETLMRQYHRWVSILAAVFLLIVSVTGVVLQVQKLTGEDADAAEHAPAVAGGLTTAMASADYAALLGRTLDAVRARAPNSPVTSVVLKIDGSSVRGVVALPGDPPRQLVVDARSGRVLSDERGEHDSLIMRIHSGAILGDPGVVLGILWGSALVILSVTGGWVYFDMYRRRRKAAKRGLFW